MLIFKNKYNHWPMVDRVFNLLSDREWQRVSAWDIVNKCKVLHYTDSIMKLRKRLWDNKDVNNEFTIIKQKNEWTKNKYWDRVRATYYMYVPPIEI